MAKNTQGNVFKTAAAGVTPLVTIGAQASVKAPQLQRGMMDTTTLDQAGQAMTSEPEGVYDPGEGTITYNAVDQDASDTLMYNAFINGTLMDGQYVTKKSAGGGTWSFQYYVSSYDPGEFTPKGMQRVTVGIRPVTAFTKA